MTYIIYFVQNKTFTNFCMLILSVLISFFDKFALNIAKKLSNIFKMSPLENKHHSKISTRKSRKKENKQVLIFEILRYVCTGWTRSPRTLNIVKYA